MTLIVGIKSKTGVVFAADRQITYGVSNFRTDIEKIERVDFQNFPAMVALADNVKNAQRFIDVLRPLAAEAAPKSADEVGVVAQKAMWVVRNEIRQTHEGETASLNDIIKTESLNCCMMIGFYLNGESHIIKTDLLTPNYERSRAAYETEGCGADLADFILKEYFEPGVDLDRTVLLAVYTVWIVTQNDRYCREPLTVNVAIGPGGLDSDGKPRVRMFSPEKVNEFVTMAKEVEKASKHSRRATIQNQFSARETEFHRMLEEEINRWQNSKLAKEAWETLSDDDRNLSLDPDDPAAPR